VCGILFDLDGVIYNSGQPVPGAASAIRWVQSEGIPHLFVTNTTSRARSVLVEKLGCFSIPARETDILTPAVAAADWLRANDPRARIALFLRPSTRTEFAGLPVLPDDAERGASYVIIGDLGDLWDFRTLNRAFRLLHYEPEAKLIALGMTRYWLASDGISLDVAPFVAALEHATGRKALIFGKPAGAFFQAASAKLGLPAQALLMIGDDIDADIGGAQAAGLKGVLVKTGKFRPSDLERGARPDAVLESVAELPFAWARLKEKSLENKQGG
jgi:phospholysine phosphohistidine inorganic pyrophosphate phosphatase